jgi:hypothetical protein
VISNGTIYEGVLKDNQFNGYLRFIKPNGDFYQGFAKDNLPEGPGNFTKAVNGFSEAGFYSKGEHFESEYLYNISMLFEKEPKNSNLKPELVQLWRRIGKFELHDYIHEGKYKMPTKDQGPITFIQTKDASYTGQVKDGEINGIGIKVSTKIEEGMFKDGELTGFGRIVYEDLSFYSGELLNGTKHGQGTLTLANGIKKTEFWKGDGVNCEESFVPLNKSDAPTLPVLPYSKSTSPVDLKVSLPQFFGNLRPDDCKPDICILKAADCEAQYTGNLILSKDFRLSAMSNLLSQEETFCVMCTEGGNQLFFENVKFSQTKCDAASQSPCPAPVGKNYKDEFIKTLASTPAFRGLSASLVQTWTDEGPFDFQEHMNDGDYQFSDQTKMVNVSTDFGNYIGQDYAVGGLGRWTSATQIIEGAFENKLGNGYARIIDSKGTYYGDLKDGLRHGQGEQIYNDGKVDGGFWIKDQFVENPLWFEVLSVFHSAPASVSEFALKTWKDQKPFAVDQLIRDNKVSGVVKTTGAVLNQTFTLGNDTKAVFSG